MKPSPAYIRQGENIVCHLQKSLYGLKQASINWYTKFSSTLNKEGFKQLLENYLLYTKTNGTSFTTILDYVDDMCWRLL